MKLRLSIFLVLLLAFSGFIVLQLSNTDLTAQDETPPPTLDPNSPEAIEARQAIYANFEEHAAALSQINVFDYHTIYLIAPDTVPTESVASVERLESTLGVVPAYSWDDLLALDAQRPINALIVHESAFAMVNITWTQNAYRNRALPIVGINLYFDSMATLTGDNCLNRSAQPPFEPDYFVLKQAYATAEIPAEREQAIEELLNVCDKEDIGQIYTYAGEVQAGEIGSQHPLQDETDLTNLIDHFPTFFLNQSRN